jgi:hypothetical protein
MVTVKQIKEIANELKVKGYKHVGIRVQEGDCGAVVGQVVGHCSNIWVDGEMQEGKLNGLCAVKAKKYSINTVDKFSGYEGNTVLILGSQKATKGYDEGEIIMSEPVVLEVRSL